MKLTQTNLESKYENKTSTNGLLKRSLALSIFSRNGYYVIAIYLLTLACFIVNGLGWISISTETLCLILTSGTTISTYYLKERETIVNFYFLSGESELDSKKTKTIIDDENVSSNLN